MPLTFTLGTTVLRQRRSKVLFQYPKQFRRVLERGDAMSAPIRALVLAALVVLLVPERSVFAPQDL